MNRDVHRRGREVDLNRINSIPRHRLAMAVVVVVLGVLAASWIWNVGGEASSPTVRTTYYYDYDDSEGLVMRGERDGCTTSWPVSTMDVTQRNSILGLTVESGTWIWSGPETAWTASGLPDPCAENMPANG